MAGGLAAGRPSRAGPAGRPGVRRLSPRRCAALAQYLPRAAQQSVPVAAAQAAQAALLDTLEHRMDYMGVETWFAWLHTLALLVVVLALLFCCLPLLPLLRTF